MTGSQRGVSLSAFFAVVVTALIIVAGLVVDGGAQAAAARRAELVASSAARAAADATAPARVSGRKPDLETALRAARRVLDQHDDVTGEVELVAGRVRVTTTSGADTVLLSLIGIRRLDAGGSAEAELVAGR